LACLEEAVSSLVKGNPSTWLRAFSVRKHAPDAWSDRVDAHAAENFRMWHQKNPRELLEAKFTFPKEVARVGRAVSICYVSDKWEDDGAFHDYVHGFDSGPGMYAADGDGPVKDTAKLLGSRTVNDTMSLTVLAYAFQVVVEVDGEEHEVLFDPPVPMVCGKNKRVLILLDKQGPIFIMGGKMTVTERGIVQ
jgi:hypothetical protein